ncbi:hypothetical protein P1X14_17090 [Sphingomonas sp. AOB5]|uniref:hypothetical protein n=1 Tax=Sphingomonas sp. AOB5 TaxID=3034017 RepID=UPI0023F999EA|nr:hypothetical protein [Sphingomonas sp. AOB5]MDF7776975.1 hypothetical protein [Sphingomonas sp. AOB5]
MIKRLLILCAMFFATPALAQANAPLSAKNPTAFAAQLRSMGYAPGPVDNSNAEFPMLTFESGGWTIHVSFGGCTNGVNCRYIVLVSIFDQVKNPPADWVAELNVDFDIIKVWRGDSGNLTFSSGAIIEGWPRSTFKAWLEEYVYSGDDLAREARNAGLMK